MKRTTAEEFRLTSEINNKLTTEEKVDKARLILEDLDDLLRSEFNHKMAFTATRTLYYDALFEHLQFEQRGLEMWVHKFLTYYNKHEV